MKKAIRIIWICFIFLILVSPTNAEVVLTINGIDAAKEPAEIEGKEKLLIAIDGKTEKDVDYSVTSEMGCKIELITEQISLAEKPQDYYLFKFEEKIGMGTVNLYADDKHIYQLVLFYNPETDKVITFGIGYDALHWVPPVEKPLAVSHLEPETFEQELVVPDALQSWRFKHREKSQDKVLMTCPSSSQVSKTIITSKEVRGSERTFAITTDNGELLLDGGVVDVINDITTNTVWISDNTYHILNPIDVNGAMLVIEPGTIVEFAAGVSAGIRTVSGGVVISRGTAQNPIVFTSDSATPVYNDYYCPLYITETGSTATEMMYTIVEWAYAGIVVLNRNLDKNIENNYFVNCVYGIVEYGPEHTNIVNNLCFGSYYSGIEVYLASTTGLADANSVIYIENNTCDYYQDNGITVHGVTANEDSGFVFIANNIVSGSYVAGLNLVDGYMYASVLNTGYYDNVANKNWEFDELNPIIMTINPYETGTSGYAPICYLNQSCDFIDAGSLLPEQTQFVGKTTSTTLVPDGNVADIGFHYPNWDHVNTGEGDYYAGDLDENLVVDFRDFAVLANSWLDTYDINALADMCGNWLITGGPAPNLLPTFDQDSNNLSDYVRVTTSISDPQIHMAWLMIDGEKYGEFGESDYGYNIDVKTEQFTNGIHSVKIVFMYGDSVICSEAIPCTFNNEVSMLIRGDGFTPGEDYHLYGLATGTYLVEIVDIINSSTIYSQSFVDGLNAHVSAASFTEEDGAYELGIKAETLLLSASWRDVVKRIVGRKFKKKDFPQDCSVKMVIFVGNKSLEKAKEKCWKTA
ncbi:MAG: right-handed parallel beta-helix repeat-containing protein, partial [Phycisphaerae bacterium]|nr:right-handed parallel beta-helix repeat-containing protein [Phycisphaerae bacterium]